MKKIIILIIIVCTIYLIFVLTNVFTKLSSRQKGVSNSPTLFPTPTPLVAQPEVNLSSPDNKLIQAIENRQTLSATDSAAKTAIITALNNQPGSPAKTDDYRIDYLPAGDLFMVEILTTNYQQAKQDAINWFLTHGFTQDGICKLPVQFYLTRDVQNQLKLTNFNPLPDGC